MKENKMNYLIITEIKMMKKIIMKRKILMKITMK